MLLLQKVANIHYILLITKARNTLYLLVTTKITQLMILKLGYGGPKVLDAREPGADIGHPEGGLSTVMDL